MASLDDEYSWTPPSEAEQKVIEARRERNNKISSIMGQYLLKGYKMLAITCPTCDTILLEDRQTNKYCIGCCEVDADTKKDNPAVSEEAARRTVEETHHRNPVQQDKPVDSVEGFVLPVLQQRTSASQSNNTLFQAQNNSYDNRPSTSNLVCNGVSTDSEDNMSVKRTGLPEPKILEGIGRNIPSKRNFGRKRRNFEGIWKEFLEGTCLSLKSHSNELQAELSNSLIAVRIKMVWATQQLESSSSIQHSQQLIGLITESCKAITALQHLTSK